MVSGMSKITRRKFFGIAPAAGIGAAVFAKFGIKKVSAKFPGKMLAETTGPTPGVVTALFNETPVFQRNVMITWIRDGNDMNAFVDRDIVWTANRRVQIDSTRIDLIVPGLGPHQINTPVGWYSANPGETVTLALTNRPVVTLSSA